MSGSRPSAHWGRTYTRLARPMVARARTTSVTSSTGKVSSMARIIVTVRWWTRYTAAKSMGIMMASTGVLRRTLALTTSAKPRAMTAARVPK